MAVYNTRRYNPLYMLRKIFLFFIRSCYLSLILSGYYLVSDSIHIGVHIYIYIYICIYQPVPWVNTSMLLAVCSLRVTASYS